MASRDPTETGSLGPEGAMIKEEHYDSGREASNTVLGAKDESALETAARALDPPTNAGETVPQAPDGGSRAWLIVLGAWCTSFCSFGWINSVGVFQEYYERDLLREYSPSTIAWIPSLQIFFMTGMGPIVGLLSDRYGPKQLILGGTILHVFGLMMASISTEYYQILLSQGVCSAIGVSAIFQPALNCISGWFNKKRGAAFGILSTGSSLGGVIFPIMVRKLIDNPKTGFPWAMRISGFLILALLILANVTVRRYGPPRPQTYTLKQFLKPFTETKFVYLTIGLTLFTFGLYIPIDYIPVEAAAAGVSTALIHYLIPIFNAASLFGRVGSGYAGDKIGRYNVFIIVCYASGIWILGLWIPAVGTASRVAFSVLFGFFSGAYVALIPALVVQISPFSEIGFRTGLVFFASSVGGLTTNPIAGAIQSHTGSWVGPKIFAGVFALLGTCFILAARLHSTGWKLAAVF